MSRFHNIVVAVDFSTTSDDAVAAAVDLSRGSRAQVHLLHVVPTVHVPYAMEPIVFDFGAFELQNAGTAQKQLAALAARYPFDASRLTTAVVAGPPASEIVRYAEEHASDLIVLGAHGHGFIDRLLIGSVAERVVRHAPCAVLMVPHVMRRLTSFQVKAAVGVEA